MRVDPESVYLELAAGAFVLSAEDRRGRVTAAAVLHWKPEGARKWERRSFLAGRDETLGDVVAQLGAYLNEHGLAATLEKLQAGAPPRAGAPREIPDLHREAEASIGAAVATPALES